MANIQVFGEVSSTGILQIPTPARSRMTKDLIKYAGCRVELTIKKRGKRGTKVNAYYRAVVVKEITIRLKELGNDVDTDITHEFLKDKFNKKLIIAEGGKVLSSYGGSTSELSHEEFSEYLDKIIQWAAEFLNIEIPMPNTQAKLFK